MARINTSAIPGWEGMTSEQKLAYLTDKYDVPDMGEYVKKSLFDKTASELAALKDKSRGELTETEKQLQEALDANKALQEQVASVLKENTIAKNKAGYLALGYDEKLAGVAAEAEANGDFAKVRECQGTFLKAHDQKIIQEALNKGGNPPPAGGKPGSMTKEAFRKLSVDERYRYSVEHPDEYQALYRN